MNKKKIIIITTLIISIILIISSIILILYFNKKPKEIELNSENFNEYIILDINVEDFKVESGRGLYSWYKGTAKLKASARLKKDVKVDNVIIKGRIVTDGLCWASKSYDFQLELDKDGKAEYCKEITTGDAGMLYPEEPKIWLYEKDKENEFCVNGAHIQVSGKIIE